MISILISILRKELIKETHLYTIRDTGREQTTESQCIHGRGGEDNSS